MLLALQGGLARQLATAPTQYSMLPIDRTKKKSGNKDTEDFVTARGTQSAWRIAWSFYAGAVGSWVIVTPSQVCTVAV